MNYLNVNQLSKALGGKELFQEVSFTINKGDKTALVAQNGTGKSTLLSVLIGEIDSDYGEFSFAKGVKVGFLSQNPKFDESQTVLEALFNSDNELVRATQEYESSLEHPDDHDRMARALEQMDQLDAWNYEAKVKKALTVLKIDNLDRKIGELSGGQKKRVALARAVLEEPDFLILDEPTNHLDLDMIEWLEDFLRRSDFTLLMVTHDRYFLERVCDHILELADGNIYSHVGNYSFYLEQKTMREERQERELAEAKNLYRRELQWIRTQPRARESKSRSRIKAFGELEQKVRAGGSRDDELKLNVKVERLGTKILEVHSLVKAFPDCTVVSGFTYRFNRGERIGVVGGNGVGKTTFLKLLSGELEPDGGTVKVGETVVFGHYSQEGIEINENLKILDAARKAGEFIQLEKGRKITASQMLQRFLFSPEKQNQLVGSLSGGERKRLNLLMVLMKNPNFLILDEPTNDLDIVTLAVLEDFLMDFPGCLIVVTHDRFFMDKLVNELFVFKGGGLVERFPGTYSEYRELEKDKERVGRVEKSRKRVEKSRKNGEGDGKKKLSFNEKREFEQLEKDIPELEKEKNEMAAELSTGALQHEEIREVSARLGEVEAELEAKSERWLELAERA